MNVKYKRILAYLFDYLLVTLFISLVSELNIINPYYEKYEESYEIYSSYVNLEPSLLIDSVMSYQYKLDYYNIYKYGIVINTLTVVIYLIYYVGFQKWNKGQTIGKRIFNIKVINDDNKELTWKQMLFRELILYNILFNLLLIILVKLLNVDAFFYISILINMLSYIVSVCIIISVLFEKNNKGIHDNICHTNVIDVKNK